MSVSTSVHATNASNLEVSRGAAERHAQLDAVHQSRQAERSVRSVSLLARLVHVFA